MADFEKKKNIYIYIYILIYTAIVTIYVYTVANCYSKLVIDPRKTYYMDWVKFNAYK